MNDRRGYNSDLDTDHAPVLAHREGVDEPATAFHERNGFHTENPNVSPRITNCPPAVVHAEHVLNHAPQQVNVNDTGVSFDRPKYIQYAIRVSRLKSYKNWSESHFLKSNELSDAGFFSCESGDTVVCFYCGLSLNAWERGDRPWTEHARWSPNCTHILNMIGPNFIKETLECGGDVIKMQAVDDKYQRIRQHGTDLQTDSEKGATTRKEPEFYEDMMQRSSVQSVLEMNIDQIKVRDAIRILIHRKKSDEFTAVQLMEIVFDIDDGNLTKDDKCALEGKVTKSEGNVAVNGSCSKSEILKENDSLRDQLTCKVCLEARVSIVFLPCGHLSCCGECAPALKNCPICRANIKGSVRTFLT
ncbi:death-associated inhibitor of apoptosis 2-like [Mizuhopecten yessoensis]|uniref:Apoptosis 2 inhibitor n=1 Tax=Mizuhopecten yessoensis TaxID=6573 RepID=A0A210Q5G3_MIZYE|nr:death-associated inhibitor of apoptosis 2-like [Mizuhopecten yessoensis]XP_021366761.1 death-associated inhibitor of apoptosis 2-like [Mizuhopecten yessoensis]XP_021366762.1 death-associated inhibitor of apoptosis 2-like [Mizuhopecten yessoensis]OWF43929.1 Apoptosis 2 inhibitor [Mizuhopecten yessoensis]